MAAVTTVNRKPSGVQPRGKSVVNEVRRNRRLSIKMIAEIFAYRLLNQSSRYTSPYSSLTKKIIIKFGFARMGLESPRERLLQMLQCSYASGSADLAASNRSLHTRLNAITIASHLLCISSSGPSPRRRKTSSRASRFDDVAAN